YHTPPFRMIKSHSEYNPYYLHSIYMARHPVSVMRSYYTFLLEHGKIFRSIEVFLQDKHVGIPAWKRHVNSWMTAENQSCRMHLVRYEDIVIDPFRELTDININLGLGFDDANIKLAIQRSESNQMKKSEELFSRRNPRYKLSFVKGQRIFFPQVLRDHITLTCQAELTLLGYESHHSKD
ncbi:MAG: sulfotransferase domain-containing protein, partial [Chloroflexota bacterium]